MKHLQVTTLTLGMMATNCYLAQNKETDEMLVFDPGDEAERIIRQITEQKGNPEAILLTHGHFDHIGAVDAIKERYDIPVYAPEKEREILMDPEKNLTGLYGTGYTLEADRYLADNEEILLAGFKIKVLYTPGHTSGSACYYFPDEDVLFSGDTLFYCSVGRTDFPTGSTMQIHRSIHERLFVLPEETEVFPGHDAATTIQYEKQNNPY